MSTKNKVSLKTLYSETCLKVTEDAACGLSQRKLAEKYECVKIQIKIILKEREAIKQKFFKNAPVTQRNKRFNFGLGLRVYVHTNFQSAVKFCMKKVTSYA